MTRRVPKPAQEDTSYGQEKEVQDLLVAEELGNFEDAPSSVNIFESFSLYARFFPLCYYLSAESDTTNIWLCSWNKCRSHPQMNYRAPGSANRLTELHF